MSDKSQAIEEFIDTPLEENIHRGVDKDGNPDDKYTEKEALKFAKADGIEFLDDFMVETQSADSEEPVIEHFDTRKEAEAFCKKNKLDPLIIIQSRAQKQPQED